MGTIVIGEREVMPMTRKPMRTLIRPIVESIDQLVS
jgi:hypothetical protein